MTETLSFLYRTQVKVEFVLILMLSRRLAPLPIMYWTVYQPVFTNQPILPSECSYTS